MKRALGVFLSFILFLGFTNTSYANSAGCYVLDSFSDGELTMGRDDIVAAGLDWSILLEEDGTAQLYFDKLVIGTWLDGIISATVEDETEELPYTIEGDALILDLYGETATFLLSDGTPPVVEDVPPQEKSGGSTAISPPTQLSLLLPSMR